MGGARRVNWRVLPSAVKTPLAVTGMMSSGGVTTAVLFILPLLSFGMISSYESYALCCPLQEQLKFSFCPAAKKNTPAFTVGRFQVMPSQATPLQPRHLWQATPTAHSPPPPTPSQSESSVSSSASDSSIRTTLGFLGNRVQHEGEELQGEAGVGSARRTSISLSEGQASSHPASQSRSRTVSTASSDESESENEEWAELQQLRER